MHRVKHYGCYIGDLVFGTSRGLVYLNDTTQGRRRLRGGSTEILHHMRSSDSQILDMKSQ